MNLKDKLIIKHALKTALYSIEFDREINQELLMNGIEFTKVFEYEITTDLEYKELICSLEKLIKR